MALKSAAVRAQDNLQVRNLYTPDPDGRYNLIISWDAVPPERAPRVFTFFGCQTTEVFLGGSVRRVLYLLCLHAGEVSALAIVKEGGDMRSRTLRATHETKLNKANLKKSVWFVLGFVDDNANARHHRGDVKRLLSMSCARVRFDAIVNDETEPLTTYFPFWSTAQPIFLNLFGSAPPREGGYGLGTNPQQHAPRENRLAASGCGTSARVLARGDELAIRIASGPHPVLTPAA
jgi:hypothetical protein